MNNQSVAFLQTEAEPEVGSLLDDLGLREKQQFVSTLTMVVFDCSFIDRHEISLNSS